jgi:selenocysteine-specific elongation factor
VGPLPAVRGIRVFLKDASMSRDLILGTAGHIDHGKTALVKALTGIDCDRLPEEKARGITIDIGFAALDLGEYRLGIVDVPGHERFVKNMLAGATGIDLALLVVAADDSVMPQTREHLEILKLLGLRHGLVALTKCDTVDDTTREVVELEVRELIHGSFLETAPIVRTSTVTGEGLAELKMALAEMGGHIKERGRDEWFRMAIDRSFIVQGHGTVVTGSVTSGTLQVGDEVEWQPKGERVRVRSLQNHSRSVAEVHRGMRAAVNLAGVHHENVVRGQEIAAPGYLVPSRNLTVRLHCLRDTKQPIKHRTPVRLHLGTSEVLGTVSLLEANAVEPGAWGLAQVFLEEPATATWGQPLVIRESSAAHTLGGGHVLQPVARKIRRRHLGMLERLEGLRSDDAECRALTVAWFGGFTGVTLADVVRGGGVGPAQAADLLDRLPDRGTLVKVPASPAAVETFLHADLVRDLEERILAALARLHEQFPLLTSHERQKVQAQLAYVANEALVELAVRRLLLQKRLLGDQRRIARADFIPKQSHNQQRLKDALLAAYRQAGLRPPRPAEFARQSGNTAASVLDNLLALCVAEGHLVHIAEDYYLHAEAEGEVRRKVAARLAEVPRLTVAEIRDVLGTGRRHAVMLCEYLDRLGVTRREGDWRVLGRSTHPSP